MIGMNTMKCNSWEIWLANVKLEDIDEYKKRPILILDAGIKIAIALKMTSHKPRKNEYVLMDWEAAGLKKETTVRISKYLQIVESDLCYKIGNISPLDKLELQRILPED